MEGIQTKNNAFGHRVVRLHYSADPDKKPGTPWFQEWTKRYLGGTESLGWRREYEIDFKAGVGELVFPSFVSLENEIVVDPFPLDETYQLYAGLDWGNRNPVSFHIYAEAPDKTFYSVFEIYVPGKGTNVFEISEAIVKCPLYERLNWIAYDPNLNAENQQRKDGNTSIARMFQEEVPEEIKINKLMTAHGRSDMLCIQMTNVLLANRKLKFFRNCPHQIDEFRNLKFPERVENKNEPEKILDKDNHAWDDYKYFVLSHPTAAVVSTGPKFGTYGYYNAVSEMAAVIASRTGKSYQKVFNELYGQPI